METPPNDAAIFTASGSTQVNGWREVFCHHHGYVPDSTQDRAAFVEPTKQQFSFHAFPGEPGIPAKQRRYLLGDPPTWLVKFRGWLTWIDVQVTKLTRFKCLDRPEITSMPPGITFHVRANGTFTPRPEESNEENAEFIQGL